MSKITIEINNINSRIIGELTPEIFLELKQALSYVVTGAQFSTYAQKGWDGTKYLFISRTQSFPTGLLRKVRAVLSKHNISYDIDDKRVKPTGFPLILKNVKLRDYQEDCIKEMTRVGRGLIQVGTSGGKGVILSGLLANLGVNSLVIVPTRELLKQTSKVISDLLGIKVGIIGDGEKDIGKITVATFQSLTTSEDTKKRKYNDTTNRWAVVAGKKVAIRPDLKEYLGSLECVFTDECFPRGVRVKTEQGYIDIAKIVNQKMPIKVWSFNIEKQDFELKPVISYYKKPSPNKLVKVMFGNHSVVRATPNHPFYVLRNKEIIKVRAENLIVGDDVISMPRKNTAKDNIPNAMNSIQKQIVLGSILADGSLRMESANCRLALCQGEKQLNYLKWKVSSLGNLITADIREEKSGYCDNKIYQVSTVIHPELNKYNVEEKEHVKLILKDLDALGVAIWFMDDGSRGSSFYRLHTESFCLESQKLFVKFFKERYNIQPKILSYRRGKKEYYYLSFSTEDSKVFENIIFPFLHPCFQYKVVSNRKIKNAYFSHEAQLNYGISKIKSISVEDSKSPFVYNLEVEGNHNYLVGNNKLVSNCHHLSADSLQAVYDSCPNAYYKFGCSATPFHDNDTDVLIEAVTGRVLRKYSASYLIANKWISQPTIHLLQFKQERLPKGITYAKAYEERITNNAERNDLVRRLAERAADENNSVLISVRQINHGEIIYDLLKDKYGDKVVFLNSKVASSKISEVLKKLSKKEVLIVIATSLINEGINVPSLDTLIFASCPKSPITTIQLVGRVLRRTETKTTVDVYDIQDYNCKFFGNASKERMDIYATEPEFILKEESQSTLDK